MPRSETFLECVVRSFGERGPPRRENAAPFGQFVDVLRTFCTQLDLHMKPNDVRAAVRELVSAPHETIELALSDAINDAAGDRPEEDRADLTAYLELLTPILRQALRRPGDALGTSVPENLSFRKPEDWLVFLPDRLTRFKPGDVLKAFDSWQLDQLRGVGPFSETWHGSLTEPESAAAALKFITHPEAAADFVQHQELFRRILDLDPLPGLVKLEAVYLLGDPPCLESTFMSGYDVVGLMNDWRWRGQPAKADQASLIIKRAARIVGELHQMKAPIIHRGLKPANILLHPTAEGKVTVWVADLGWAATSAAHALQQADPVQEKRQARRGSRTILYSSPQQRSGLPPDPRDDVFSLGVVWYQMLRCDPTLDPPDSLEETMELRKLGLSEGHARLLASCLDENPQRRPANGLVLASQIDAHFTKPPESGSKTFQLKGSESIIDLPPVGATPIRKSTSRVDLPKTLENSLGMTFRLIEPGMFEMGSPAHEKGRHDWEGPVHPVAIGTPFYIAIYPVTQAQYQLVTGRNPAHFSRMHGGGLDHPVEQVSWEDSLEYCSKLMEMPDEAAMCRVYRLPTEAEWEYACRAGSTTAYAFGDTVTMREVHYFGLNAATWAKVARTAGKSERVGQHPPNAWGLHDMHGNVLEWCQDWWSEVYYSESPVDDPLGPDQGMQRVVRGGSFSQFAFDCRSAARLGRAPTCRLGTVGFRVVSVPSEY